LKKKGGTVTRVTRRNTLPCRHAPECPPAWTGIGCRHASESGAGLGRNPQLAKAELLVLDDFGLMPMSEQTKRDLLEILDDRYDRRSTLVTSQLPVDQWHTYLNDPTLADAILDRLVHNSYRLTLKGESMRKQKTVEAKTATPTKDR
jgi:hypothetical protein